MPGADLGSMLQHERVVPSRSHTQGTMRVGGEVKRAVDFHCHAWSSQHDINREQLIISDTLILMLHAHGRQHLRDVAVQA